MRRRHIKLTDAEAIINRFNVSEKVKQNAVNVYRLLAEAESYAHQEPVGKMYFHEVGAMDAIVDILTVCYLLDRLKIDRIEATPVATGEGYIKSDYGILPVPTPAAKYLLKDLPHYSGNIQTELCTPTGAALLKYFVSSFENSIDENYTKSGTGFGKKEFTKPDVLKVYLYDDSSNDEIILLECLVTDMTVDEIDYVLSRLYESGALEIFIDTAQIKGKEYGYVLSVLTDESHKNDLISTLFRFTPTSGIRETPQ